MKLKPKPADIPVVSLKKLLLSLSPNNCVNPSIAVGSIIKKVTIRIEVTVKLFNVNIFRMSIMAPRQRAV
jgi:hypothetical protein